MLAYTTVCRCDTDEIGHRVTAAPPARTTRDLADNLVSVEWAHLPERARAEAARHLLDTVGVAVAGSRSPITQTITAAIAAPPGTVPRLGLGTATTSPDAAFAVAVAAHSIEFDDGYREGSIHPGTCVVPVALALGYELGSSGAEVLAAVAAGYEAAALIGRVAHPALRRKGFHPTGAVGVFGAAAAAGRLLNLDGAALAGAFGIAASGAGGLFAFLSGGPAVKRLHAGNAARNGLVAAALAARGVYGPADILHAVDGFMQAFTGTADSELPAVAVNGRWAVEDAYIKPYPCCRHLHTSVDLVLDLIRRNAIDSRDIEQVRIATYSVAAAHDQSGWDTPEQAQLSFRYVMTRALLDQDITLDTFEPDRLTDPRVFELAPRIHVHADSACDREYPRARPANVRITTSQGAFEATASEARGDATVPLSNPDLTDKFLRLSEPVLGKAEAKTLLEELALLPEANNSRSVLDLTAAKQPSGHTTQLPR